MAKSTKLGQVESRLHREDHASFDRSVVTMIQERIFVIAQADGVPAVVFPLGHQIVFPKIGARFQIDGAAGFTGFQRFHGDGLQV